MSAAPFRPSGSARDESEDRGRQPRIPCFEFPPMPSLRPEYLERRSATEPELLDAVICALGDRNRVVEAERSEGRSPDEADAHGGANHVAVVVLQSQTGSSVGRSGRPRRSTGCWDSVVEAVDFVSCNPTG